MTTPNLARWRAFHSLIQPRHWGIECGDDGEDIVVAPSLSEETAKYVAEAYNNLLERTGVPEGWQLVPKEPAWEILKDEGINQEDWARFLAAMLSAAPQPPTGADEDQFFDAKGRVWNAAEAAVALASYGSSCRDQISTLTRERDQAREALANLMRRLDDHFGGVDRSYDWKEQAVARSVLHHEKED